MLPLLLLLLHRPRAEQRRAAIGGLTPRWRVQVVAYVKTVEFVADSIYIVLGMRNGPSHASISSSFDATLPAVVPPAPAEVPGSASMRAHGRHVAASFAVLHSLHEIL